MKICIVTIAGDVHGIGGMQQHTVDLARTLAAAGHEVDVITAAHPDGVRELERDGVRWRFVDGPSRHMAAAWREASYAAFEDAHRRSPYDVVHGEGSSALELVRRGADRRVPLVNEFHGNFLGLARAGVRRAATARAIVPALREARALVFLSQQHFPHGNWRLLRRCEAIVPSQQQLRDTVRSHLLREDRVHVVPNGVDTVAFRPRPASEARAELGLPEGPLLVSVGRLNREKGTHHAIRTLACLGPDVRLAVVGDGEEREALQRLAEREGVAERVIFAGAQPVERVADYLAAADVFVFPTERDEAAPLVVPQALAAGRPVVTTRIGGIPEVVDRPGENGVLVEPGDFDGLVHALRLLVADPALRERLGHAARERALERYTLEGMAEGTLAVYERAIARLHAAERAA